MAMLCIIGKIKNAHASLSRFLILPELTNVFLGNQFFFRYFAYSSLKPQNGAARDVLCGPWAAQIPRCFAVLFFGRFCLVFLGLVRFTPRYRSS
jgi:hypothetical protein